MRLFIDTANIAEIREANALGIVDGVTTNPSLIAKEGRDFLAVVKEICAIVDGPISAEVLSLKADEMVKEGIALSKLHRNIVIKIPLTAEGLKATKALSKENVKTNLTLCFSPTQALLAAKAGADIATVPYAVLMALVKHPLTDIGIDRFLKDWQNAAKR